jgi:hypothetical protein
MEEDSQQDMLSKLAECNPGALMAMMGLMQCAEERGRSPLLPLFQLDGAGVYGSSIWTLHKDVCGQSPSKVSNVLDALQNGDISRAVLYHAIRNRGVGIPPWVMNGPGRGADDRGWARGVNGARNPGGGMGAETDAGMRR